MGFGDVHTCAEVQQPRQVGVGVDPILQPPIHDTELLEGEESRVEVLEGALVPRAQPQEPRPARQFRVEPHEVLRPVLQDVACGVVAGVEVGDAADRGLFWVVIEVRGEADGVGVRVPGQDVQLRLPPGAAAHQGGFPSSHAAPAGVQTPEPQARQRVGKGAPLAKGELDEIVVFLEESGHVQEALECPHLQALLESGFDVDGGFWAEPGIGVHLQGTEPRADELFCDGREAEALPHAGTQPRGLSRLEIEPRPEHGLGGRGVVDREMLVPRSHTQVEALAQLLVQLGISTPVARLVHAVLVAAAVELRLPERQLVHRARCERAAFPPQRLVGHLHLVLRVEHVAGVALAVVVVVDEVLPAVAKAVSDPRGPCVFHVRVDSPHQLLGARGGAGAAGVQAGGAVFPNQGVQRFALLPIRVDAVSQSINATLTPAKVHVEAGLGVGAPPVHAQGVVGHRRRVQRRPSEAVEVDLRALEAVVAQEVAPDHHVPTSQLLAVQEPQVGLLQLAVPVLGCFCAPWVAVHAVLQAHAGQGPRVGVARADVDHPAQCGAPVEHRAGAFDDFDLLQIFERQEPPGGPSGISAEDGQIVHQHHDARAGAVGKAASTPDLGFSVHEAHAWGLFDGGFQRGGRLVFHQRRLEHLQRDGDLRSILFKPPGRHNHQAQRLCGRDHHGVPGEFLAGGKGEFLAFVGHADERAHQRVDAGRQVQSVCAVEVGGHRGRPVGHVGANDRRLVAVDHAALDGLAPKGGPAERAQKQRQGGEDVNSHETK